MGACHSGLRGLAVMDAMQKLPVVPAGRRRSTSHPACQSHCPQQSWHQVLLSPVGWLVIVPDSRRQALFIERQKRVRQWEALLAPACN